MQVGANLELIIFVVRVVLSCTGRGIKWVDQLDRISFRSILARSLLIVLNCNRGHFDVIRPEATRGKEDRWNGVQTPLLGAL